MQTEKCKFNISVDKYSNLIVGFYVELDRPSGAGVTLALEKAMSDKDDYSRRFNTDIILMI